MIDVVGRAQRSRPTILTVRIDSVESESEGRRQDDATPRRFSCTPQSATPFPHRMPMTKVPLLALLTFAASTLLATSASAQIGRRFPSEKKIVQDPVTGVPLTFLTSTPAGDSKIYPTHHQWTADGKWVVFRSNRVRGQAMAVNEETGDIVQVTEGGYSGMLCLADHSMNLYFLRNPGRLLADASGAPGSGGATVAAPGTKSDAPPYPEASRFPVACRSERGSCRDDPPACIDRPT